MAEVVGDGGTGIRRRAAEEAAKAEADKQSAEYAAIMRRRAQEKDRAPGAIYSKSAAISF